jgi:hypothetical protein
MTLLPLPMVAFRRLMLCLAFMALFLGVVRLLWSVQMVGPLTGFLSGTLLENVASQSHDLLQRRRNLRVSEPDADGWPGSM